MTSQGRFLTVSERLERLERENRRIKSVGLAASLLAVCTLIMGQTHSPRTLEAEKFVLRDATGRMRADLSMLPYEIGPSLSLYDADGKSRVELTAMKAADTNQSSLIFRDEKGKTRAAFGMLADRSGLTLSDADGKAIWSAPPGTQGPSATLTRSRPRVFLEVWSSAGPWKDEREAGPLEQETQLLTQTCPQTLVTVEPQNSDFTLRLTHHYPGGDFLRPDSPPPDYDLDFYRWSLIRREGEVIETGTNDSLAGAIKQACNVLMKH